ncbi:hypothetical protein CY34DRAFT_19183 [Suillus luteus UH-Slu-Lm8-n1]|uniref:Uncharacterized protein n=1 Tax=Suillus luteus UH-Slu-Lm8-n1 TaxID=930992 RepID=A0A0C9Z493_9AGAM|nr:hypothetical protein CY34DRAFT_19183 [Suillus luteus UH-Slu-Lm8-n1]
MDNISPVSAERDIHSTSPPGRRECAVYSIMDSQGHTQWLYSLRSNFAGWNHVVSGSGGKTIRVWDTETSGASDVPLQARRSVPLVDVFATRGKHRTANRHTGERDKRLQQQHPPRQQAHAAASSRSTPPAGTSNVVGGATPAMLQTEDVNTFATTTHPSPLNVEHDSGTTCFAVLTGCFPRLSRTRQTRSAAPHTG